MTLLYYLGNAPRKNNVAVVVDAGHIEKHEVAATAATCATPAVVVAAAAAAAVVTIIDRSHTAAPS